MSNLSYLAATPGAFNHTIVNDAVEKAFAEFDAIIGEVCM